MNTHIPADKDAASVVAPKTHTYRTLDAWRGLASLWVVLYHTSAPLVDRLHLAPGGIYLLPLNGYLRVSVFFVVSGYCIAHAAALSHRKADGLKRYAAARFRRVYWPCVLSLPLYVALGVAAAFLVSHHYLKSSSLAQQDFLHHGFVYYASNLTLTQIVFNQQPISSVCWTLCYEAAFYVLVGLLLALRLRTEHRRPAAKIAFVSAVCLVLVFDWLNRSGGCIGRGTRLTFSCALAMALLMWLLHRYDERLMKFRLVQWASWLGLFSYSLYLTHWLVVGLVLQVLSKAHLEIPALCLAAAPAVSVAAAYGFYQICERSFTKKRAAPAGARGRRVLS